MLPEVFRYESNEVRVMLIDGQPWWVAKDVCDVLSISISQTRRLDDDERGLRLTQTPSGDQEMVIVNEPGLYSLVLGSRKPEAKPFKRWVTHEVLPAIRKTGQYSAAPAIQVPQTLAQALSLAAKVEAERERLALEVTEMKPKARFHDAMMKCDDGQSINEAAKVLNTGEKRFFAWLRGMGYLMKDNRPYQKYVDQGIFKVSERLWTDKNGNERVYTKTLVTPKGLKYFSEKMAVGQAS